MKKTSSRKQDFHSDWLSQVDIEGPFLALPVLKDIWKDGVDRLGDADDRLLTYKQAFTRWQRALDKFAAEPRTPESKSAYAEVNHAWIYTVLDQLAEWDELRTDVDVSVQSPGEQVTVTATAGLEGRDGQAAALLLICEPTPGGLRETGLDGWPATEVDRLAMLLRKANVEVGIVTDGQWWALVSARDEKPTGSGMFNALTWAEEPLLRDAFFTLINQRRFCTLDTEQRLTKLFERSELEAEAITEALGTQVRRSVELLVQAFSEARLKAAKGGDPDPLTEKPDDVYQAAVTVMMRIVFLLFAEERDMLPTEQLYWESYAIKDLLAGLQAQAAGGEEQLDETYDAWHRLLAVSKALHGGVNYDEMRMPAYGGSLLDPDRFLWLHAVGDHGLRLKVSDRVMMHALDSVQTVVTGGERRRISFQEVDVEQIGYIYEGLLGYSCATVTDDIILGLVGKDGEEPEIPLGTLNELWDEYGGDPKKVATALMAWTKGNQPAATTKSAAALTKLIAKEPTPDERAELVRLLTPVAGGDADLLETLVGLGNLIRRDLRNIPLVFPIGGLVVVETPSRKNAGAHYTPRSLAEEVVLYTLQPLVYRPGPLQTNDDKEWKLKPAAEILDLKVADIAAGSGAFLVAAARYLAERVIEAWTREDMLGEVDLADASQVKRRALREVIARCLYGADINSMAVEMCKLSLWLVSMDKTKPFSFVDDKIFCGNSLLGLTSLDQLRYLHISPEPARMHQSLLVDVDAKIAAAAKLRYELASPVEDHDPMRSARAKLRLLEQVHRATEDLRMIADGVIAAGLPLGGKPGRQLDGAFKTLSWQVGESFPADGSHGSSDNLLDRIENGLTPSVDTDYERWKPLHWAIEAPDVLVEHGGFDAVVGNPPFLGGKKLAGAVGANVRDWLVNVVSPGAPGGADLAAHFLRRVAIVLRQGGSFGLICTNTIAQGDTREAGLDVLTDREFTLTRAIRSAPWPSISAALSFAAIWATNQRVGSDVSRWLDGQSVTGISSVLEPIRRVGGAPLRLAANRDQAYVGTYILGKGFILSDADARQTLKSGDADERVVQLYLGADDLVTRPDRSASRWVINFHDWPIEQAREFGVFKIVEQEVRAERQRKKEDGSFVLRKPLPQRWWQYADKRPALYKALEQVDEAVVIPRVSKVFLPVLASAKQVIADSCVVFPTASRSLFALLSSAVHQVWVMTYSSTLGATIRYTPSDVFETFPFPGSIGELEVVGRALNSVRSDIMTRRQIGITGLYNLVNDYRIDSDAEIERLRAAHVSVDRAVTKAYGWDIELDHGFHTYRQMERWTMSPTARVEILDRLVELNHERARAEGQVVPEQIVANREDTLFS
ncbi:Eco57I restriction-modification methylase domain-containing protein [Gordonia sp. KTR9]|uniref:Eco57I restriction-modification methylase domain-containing protein n=1 Tax=Gordonia sp. KTR9 TaxID=337191 RepID=UPI00027DE233|nr:type IIL restriction-modification enzyme MmeI [Gordonia sp. KTR9]AFR49095.1 Type II restriction enzyme, methylase subunits [Gordonia sp. KTR9]